jgi:hypothetical protein
MGNGLFVKDVLAAHPSIQYTGCDYSDTMVEEAIRMNAIYIEKGKLLLRCALQITFRMLITAFQKYLPLTQFTSGLKQKKNWPKYEGF